MNKERRFGLTRRRSFLVGGALAAGGGAAAVISRTLAERGAQEYPRVRIAKLGQLTPGKSVPFDYPLEGQRNLLFDMGGEVPGGVGSRSSIVAYSVLCQHMGCPLAYLPDRGYLLCGCHQSKYDPARSGTVVQGVAQRPLPRVALELDGDDVFAVGVEGLVYGYRDNLEPGTKVE